MTGRDCGSAGRFKRGFRLCRCITFTALPRKPGQVPPLAGCPYFRPLSKGYRRESSTEQVSMGYAGARRCSSSK